MTELDAEALELELLHERLQLIDVLAQGRRREPLQRRLLELAGRLREVEHLADRGLRELEREQAAQPQADEEAAPATEELADVEAERGETAALERARQGLAVGRLRRLRGGVEELAILRELA